MFCLELGYLVLGVVQQLSQNFFSMLTLHGRRRCNAITDPLYLSVFKWFETCGLVS